MMIMMMMMTYGDGDDKGEAVPLELVSKCAEISSWFMLYDSGKNLKEEEVSF